MLFGRTVTRKVLIKINTIKTCSNKPTLNIARSISSPSPCLCRYPIQLISRSIPSVSVTSHSEHLTSPNDHQPGAGAASERVVGKECKERTGCASGRTRFTDDSKLVHLLLLLVCSLTRGDLPSNFNWMTIRTWRELIRWLMRRLLRSRNCL